MTTRIDRTLSAKFQASCLNFNHYIKKLFGEQYGIDKHLAFSLQFSAIDKDQLEQLENQEDLPKHIRAFISDFEKALSQEEFDNPQFAYRLLFVPKTANHRGQEDQVIEFVKSDSPLAQEVNKAYTVIRETEKPKHRATQIVAILKGEGFSFSIHEHTLLWRAHDAKNPAKGYGVDVAGYWYWYDRWVDFVRAELKGRQSA
jgi:hypothetical protein